MYAHQKGHPSRHLIFTDWFAAKPQIQTENKSKLGKMSQLLLFVQIVLSEKAAYKSSFQMERQ